MPAIHTACRPTFHIFRVRAHVVHGALPQHRACITPPAHAEVRRAPHVRARNLSLCKRPWSRHSSLRAGLGWAAIACAAGMWCWSVLQCGGAVRRCDDAMRCGALSRLRWAALGFTRGRSGPMWHTWQWRWVGLGWEQPRQACVRARADRQSVAQGRRAAWSSVEGRQENEKTWAQADIRRNASQWLIVLVTGQRHTIEPTNKTLLQKASNQTTDSAAILALIPP